MNREEQERQGIRSGRQHKPRKRGKGRPLEAGDWITWSARKQFYQIAEVQSHRGRAYLVLGGAAHFNDHICRDDGAEFDEQGNYSGQNQRRIRRDTVQGYNGGCRVIYDE